MSRFLAAQLLFLGAQGETELASDLGEDAGTPGEKPALPDMRWRASGTSNATSLWV